MRGRRTIATAALVAVPLLGVLPGRLTVTAGEAERLARHAQSLTLQYRFSEAESILERALARHPRNFALLRARALQDYQRGYRFIAADRVVALARENALDPELLLLAARVREDLQPSPERALRYVEKALGGAPRHGRAHAYRARLWVRTRGLPEALARVRRGSLMIVSPAEYHWVVGEAYLEGGLPERALPLLERAVAAEPGRGELRLSLARALEGTGAWPEAVAQFRFAATIDPLCREGLFEAARLEMKRGRDRAAEELLTVLLLLAPEYPGAHAKLAQVYERRGIAGEVIRHLEWEASLDGRRLKPLVRLGEKHLQRGEFDRAIATLLPFAGYPLTRVLEQEGWEWGSVQTWMDGHLALARAYRAAGAFAEAARILETLVEASPDAPEVIREAKAIRRRDTSLPR